jgi:LysM repeat protein
MQELIKQMNDGFEKVSKGTAAPPSTNTFSSDYPQKGFVHKVEKGETVSSIAKKYESKVKWIIDANQIEDPTKVFVGKELFVPQK